MFHDLLCILPTHIPFLFLYNHITTLYRRGGEIELKKDVWCSNTFGGHCIFGVVKKRSKYKELCTTEITHESFSEIFTSKIINLHG